MRDILCYIVFNTSKSERKNSITLAVPIYSKLIGKTIALDFNEAAPVRIYTTIKFCVHILYNWEIDFLSAMINFLLQD